MILTREQRIEAYTYALFCALSGDTHPARLMLFNMQLMVNRKIEAMPLRELQFELKERWVLWSNRKTISALCRAIEQAEKSKA